MEAEAITPNPSSEAHIQAKARCSKGGSTRRGATKVYNVELGMFDCRTDAHQALKKLPNRYSMSAGYGYGGYNTDGSYWSVHGCLDHDNDVQRTACGVYVKVTPIENGKWSLKATREHSPDEVQAGIASQADESYGVPKWCFAEVLQAIELNVFPSAIHNNLKCVSSCHLVVV